MLRYKKSPPPADLTKCQSQPNASWANFSSNLAWSNLEHDQGYLCAYCQRRLDHLQTPIKVEHWRPQSECTAAQTLDWKNLLGVCSGISTDTAADPATVRHCDTARGDIQPQNLAILFLHPVKGQGADPHDFLRYGADGKISAEDPRARDDVDKKLNLNAPILTRSRRAVYEQLRNKLQRKDMDMTAIRQEYQQNRLVPGRPAPEYIEFVRYHLRRWAKKQGYPLPP